MAIPTTSSTVRGAVDDDPRHRPGSPGLRRLNLAMFLAGLAGFGLLYSIQPLLPQLSSAYGISATTAALSVSTATGALAVAALPTTIAARRWGRVRVMRVSLLVAVAATLVVAVAPSYAVLLGARVLTGVALAGVVATAMGHMGAEVHPRSLGAVMGLYVAGNSVGGVSGRVVVSAVVGVTGWRGALGVLGALALLCALAFWILIPPAISSAGDEVAAGRGRERVPAALLSLVVVPFTMTGGFVAVYNYLDYRLLAPPFSLTPAVAGLVFLAYLGGTVASALAGRAADAVGRLPVVLTGVLVALVGLALTLSEVLALVVVGVVVFTVGFFTVHATASGWAPALLPRRTTTASAAYVFAFYAGSSVFGAAVGEAWRGGGWTGTVVAVAALVVTGGLAALATARLARRG